MGYYTYFLVFQADDIVNNPYNKRQESIFGKSYSGKNFQVVLHVLAETIVDEGEREGNETRVYPYNNLFAQVGWDMIPMGKLGLDFIF
jgi:peptidoglycan glycosyltransferase